jgi:hypothetical protein
LIGTAVLLELLPSVLQWVEPQPDLVLAPGDSVPLISWRWQCGWTSEYEPCFYTQFIEATDKHCTQRFKVAIWDESGREKLLIYEKNDRYCVGLEKEVIIVGARWLLYSGERDQVHYVQPNFVIPASWEAGEYTIAVKVGLDAEHMRMAFEPLVFRILPACSDQSPSPLTVHMLDHDFKASFDSLTICPSLDREGFVCTSGPTELFRPHRQWDLNTCVGCSDKREHRVELWHTELRSGWRGMRIDVAGVSPNTLVTVDSNEFCQNCWVDSTAGLTGCASGHFCATLALSDNQEDMLWDTPIPVRFKLNFDSTDAFTNPASTADIWTLWIVRKRMLDSSLRVLNVLPMPLSPLFQPDFGSGVTRDLFLTLPRLRDDPLVFNVDLTTTDVFAKVMATYTPPIRDNGPIDTERTPLPLELPLLLLNPGDPLRDYPTGLWRVTGLSKLLPAEYQAVPYGFSRLDLIVTNDKGDKQSVYRIHITKQRHTDSRIRSLLPSLGVMAPVFGPYHHTYTLLIHASEPTLGFRMLFTLNDEFANATASLFGAAAGDSFAASQGTELPVTPFRQCGYNQMLAASLPYGLSTLALLVTADDGTQNVTSFSITKVSFRLLNLTVSEGSLSPPFRAEHASYTLALPNAQSSVTLTATTPDHTANVTIKYQAVGSRRGSVTLDKVHRQLDPATGFTTLTLQLTDLPLGSASVSIRVRASDQATSVYFLRIERMLEPALALQGFGQAWESETVTALNQPQERTEDASSADSSSNGGGSAGSTGPTSAAAASGTKPPSSSGVLTPSYDLSISNYTLWMDLGVTSATFTFAVAASDVTISAVWFANPSPYVNGQAIMPLRVQTLYRLVVHDVSKQPGLLLLRIKNSNGAILQRYDITIVQRVSRNCMLASVWANHGSMQPTAFRFDRHSYNLSLDLRSPGYPTNAPLRLLIVPQDAEAKVQGSYAMPAHRSSLNESIVVQAAEGPLHLSGYLQPQQQASDGEGTGQLFVPPSLALLVVLPDLQVPLTSSLLLAPGAEAALPMLTFQLTAQDDSICTYRIGLLRTLAAEPSIHQLAYAQAVLLTLSFSLDLLSVDVATLRAALELDLSIALDEPIVRFLARNVRSGSLLIDVWITPSNPADTELATPAREIGEALLRQITAFTGSPLSLGRVSQHIDTTRAPPVMEQGCITTDGTFLKAAECGTAPTETKSQGAPADSVTGLPTIAVVIIVLLAVLLCAAVLFAGIRYYRARRHAASCSAAAVPSASLSKGADLAAPVPPSCGSDFVAPSVEGAEATPVSGSAPASFDIESPRDRFKSHRLPPLIDCTGTPTSPSGAGASAVELASLSPSSPSSSRTVVVHQEPQGQIAQMSNGEFSPLVYIHTPVDSPDASSVELPVPATSPSPSGVPAAPQRQVRVVFRTGQAAGARATPGVSSLTFVLLLLACLLAFAPAGTDGAIAFLKKTHPDQALVFYPVSRFAGSFVRREDDNFNRLMAAVLAVYNDNGSDQNMIRFSNAFPHIYIARSGLSNALQQGEECECTADTGLRKVVFHGRVPAAGPSNPAVPPNFQPAVADVVGGCRQILKGNPNRILPRTSRLLMGSNGPTAEYKVCVEYMIPSPANVQRMRRGVSFPAPGVPPPNPMTGGNVGSCAEGSMVQPVFGDMANRGCAWSGVQPAWSQEGFDAPMGAALIHTPADLLIRMTTDPVPADPSLRAAAFMNKYDHWDARYQFDRADPVHTRTYSITRRDPVPVPGSGQFVLAERRAAEGQERERKRQETRGRGGGGGGKNSACAHCR